MHLKIYSQITWTTLKKPYFELLHSVIKNYPICHFLMIFTNYNHSLCKREWTCLKDCLQIIWYPLPTKFWLLSYCLLNHTGFLVCGGAGGFLINAKILLFAQGSLMTSQLIKYYQHIHNLCRLYTTIGFELLESSILDIKAKVVSSELIHSKVEVR